MPLRRLPRGARRCSCCNTDLMRVRKGSTVAYCPRCDLLIDMRLSRPAKEDDED